MRTFAILAILSSIISVLQGQSPAPLRLSLDEAIQRGMRSNLGIAERESQSQIVRAERLRALSSLLPTVNGSIGENVQRNNLAVFGFRFPGVPQIIGPFGYSDIRAFADVDLYNRASRLRLKAAKENLRVEDLNMADARDLVVQAVANAYLSIIAANARVDAARSESATAQALYERAKELHTAGVTSGIDELRAEVEWKTRQQQVLIAQNEFAKGKLTLARVIGLPTGQDFELADQAPYAPLEGLTAEQISERARSSRSDYLSLKAQLDAAQIRRQAASAQRLPVLAAGGNYGANGVNTAQLYRTFAFTGSIKMNLFDGGRIQADVAEADAQIYARKAEIADLERQIDWEIRTALLDLRSASDQVAVAEENLALAQATLEQARGRFSAGVSDNIEVVQAQDSVAGSQERLINSRYAHNLAKVSLARAVGMAETNLKQFMGSGAR